MVFCTFCYCFDCSFCKLNCTKDNMCIKAYKTMSYTFLWHKNWFCCDLSQSFLQNLNKTHVKEIACVYKGRSASLHAVSHFIACFSFLDPDHTWTMMISEIMPVLIVTSHCNPKQPSCFAHPVHCCRWYSIYIHTDVTHVKLLGMGFGGLSVFEEDLVDRTRVLFKFTWSSCYYFQISRSTIQIVCHSSSQMLSILNSS